MKIKDFDFKKDWEDFADAFNYFNNLTLNDMLDGPLIEWVNMVIAELERLHRKTNQIAKELIELQND